MLTPEPTHRNAGVLRAVLDGADHSRHVPDAHLAALAIEHGLTLDATDGDFARLSRIVWENPLDVV